MATQKGEGKPYPDSVTSAQPTQYSCHPTVQNELAKEINKTTGRIGKSVLPFFI